MLDKGLVDVQRPSIRRSRLVPYFCVRCQRVASSLWLCQLLTGDSGRAGSVRGMRMLSGCWRWPLAGSSQGLMMAPSACGSRIETRPSAPGQLRMTGTERGCSSLDE